MTTTRKTAKAARGYGVYTSWGSFVGCGATRNQARLLLTGPGDGRVIVPGTFSPNPAPRKGGKKASKR